jgi:hypothetical protein
MTTQQLQEITQPLEDRIATLEAELARLAQILVQPHPWWHSVFGSFAGCVAFDEMERFGQDWRRSQNDDRDVE